MVVLEIGGCRGNWLLLWKLKVVVEIGGCRGNSLLSATTFAVHSRGQCLWRATHTVMSLTIKNKIFKSLLKYTFAEKTWMFDPDATQTQFTPTETSGTFLA